MIPALQQQNRRVIPRWRDSSVAAITGELAPLKMQTVTQLGSTEDFCGLIREWRQNRSVAFASDLLAAALLLDFRENSDAMEAADYITSLGEDAPSLARSLAEYIQVGDETNELTESARVLSEDQLAKNTQGMIRQKKGILRRQPRNTLAWVDIARCYANLGQNRKALAAMSNGLILAPNNRFVLRSAARMYVHMGRL